MDIRTIDQMLEPGESLDDFLMSCRNDPSVFMNRLIGLENLVKEFHVEWFNQFLNNKRNVVLSFRGSGKTEILGVLFFLYISLFKKDKQMLLVSKTLEMSKEILKRVRYYIEGNEILMNLKPLHHELTWTKTEINTQTGCVLFCKPYSDNIRTWHVDYCFLDEAGFYPDKSIFYYTIVPILQFKGANLMVSSTPTSKIDLPNELAKLPDYWSKIYPIVSDDNVPLWPEKYPLIKINKIRQDVGSQAKFDREYLCKPVSAEGALITADRIERACDDSLQMIENGEAGKIYYAGFDFALSATGNYSVFVILEDYAGKLIVRYAERHRGMDYKFQEERIKEIFKRFPFIVGVADKGSFGRIIVEDLQSDGIPIEGFDTQSRKEEMFLKLSAKFGENPTIVIPCSIEEPYTKSMSDIIIKEISEIVPITTNTGYETYGKAGAYNDAAVALALAVWAIQEAVEVEPMVEFI